MKRWMILLYGVSSYLLFFGVFLYAVLWIGNLFVPRALDSEPTIAFWPALGINVGLLVLFSIQHSGMARQPFKKWLTSYIPEPAERSTYVLMSNIAMILFFVFWQPLGGVVWSTSGPFAVGAIYGLYFIGWGLVFASTLAICHFDLFGLRQVWLYFRGKPYVHHEFTIPKMYTVVRHPLYVGWLIVMWAAPVMTLSHLLFAAGATAYILAAIQLEERDLIRAFGRKYLDYRKRVPMLIPRMQNLSPDAGSGILNKQANSKA